MSGTPCLVIPTDNETERTSVHAALDTLESIGIALPAVDTGTQIVIVLQHDSDAFVVQEQTTLDGVDDAEDAIDVFIDATGDRRETLYDAEEHLINAGVSFDTGTAVDGDTPTRHWSLDFSLEGARIERTNSVSP